MNTQANQREGIIELNEINSYLDEIMTAIRVDIARQHSEGTPVVEATAKLPQRFIGCYIDTEDMRKHCLELCIRLLKEWHEEFTGMRFARTADDTLCYIAEFAPSLFPPN